MRRRPSLLLLALTLIAAPAFPQSGPAAAPDPPFLLRGTVWDTSHAAIAGARISTTTELGTAGPSATTDARGAFELALGAGRYTLTAASEGFLDGSLAITARRGAAQTIDIVLTVAGFEETVSVTADRAPTPYQVPAISSSTKTSTPLRDVPQSVTIVSKQLIQDQLMTSVANVVRYVPGITAHQGENNRYQVIIRGNSSSADFFVDGVRDDVQYYRDLYNLERVEALKGPNAMIFGRGGGGGVINRVTKSAGFTPVREFSILAGSFGQQRVTADVGQAVSSAVAIRLNAMYENGDSYRQSVDLERYGISPSMTYMPDSRTKLTIGYEH